MTCRFVKFTILNSTCTIPSVADEGVNRGSGVEFFAAVEEGEFDEEGGGDDVGVEGFEEFDGGSGSAAGGEEVIDEEDVFARFDGVFVDFDDGFAVFEGVGHRARGPWEFSLFSHGNEACAENMSNAGSEDEATGINADDTVDFGVSCGGSEVFE